MGKDYPSQTFSGLKRKETMEFGEFRTQRLVLEAWREIGRMQIMYKHFIKPTDTGVREVSNEL